MRTPKQLRQSSRGGHLINHSASYRTGYQVRWPIGVTVDRRIVEGKVGVDLEALDRRLAGLQQVREILDLYQGL